MIEETYTIVGRKMKGLTITDFILVSNSGEQKTISYTDCEKLTKLEKVTNAKIILDITTGESMLKVIGGMDSIPKQIEFDRYKPVARIVNNKKCVGYIVEDNSGSQYRLSINKVWELATRLEVAGLRGVIIGNKKALVSNTEDLIKSLNVKLT